MSSAFSADITAISICKNAHILRSYTYLKEVIFSVAPTFLGLSQEVSGTILKNKCYSLNYRPYVCSGNSSMASVITASMSHGGCSRHCSSYLYSSPRTNIQKLRKR